MNVLNKIVIVLGTIGFIMVWGAIMLGLSKEAYDDFFAYSSPRWGSGLFNFGVLICIISGTIYLLLRVIQ